ncbi:uncharacterized protein LOC125285982 [Alosa alosa]|uniref:uncharacterized protein LOC125285982 n=1 Tax=Alosa alosa TaxID=278164 RepID=UPI0020153822|nr:uncharacterized protein LOC125285982 [Alosa alosa]
MECTAVVAHDSSVPDPMALDMTATENLQLKEQIRLMSIEMGELKIQATFGLHRFAGSDDDIRFYTRFAGYRHLMIFWSLIEPSVPLMIRTSRAKAVERKKETISVVRPAHTSLQTIDEFFLFLMYLVASLKERDLANRFFLVHQSTVSRIISTWTNYLYTILGSVGIWMEKEDVQANLPKVFQDFSDTQVIVDCTELRCQTPSSLLLQKSGQ